MSEPTNVISILSRCWSQAMQQRQEAELGREWLLGDKHWVTQHPARTWEYALALSALDAQGAPLLSPTWPSDGRLVLDVGGAGSPLAWIIAAKRGLPVQVIDPEFNGVGLGETEANRDGYKGEQPFVAALKGKADFIACISVIEHVEDEEVFLRDLVALLAPGGVLFLTTDYVEELGPSGKDEFQFHWMRKRIYTRWSWFGEWSGDTPPPAPGPPSIRLRLTNGVECGGLGCQIFNAYDTTYHGPIPDLGYSFASLCVRKER